MPLFVDQSTDTMGEGLTIKKLKAKPFVNSEENSLFKRTPALKEEELNVNSNETGFLFDDVNINMNAYKIHPMHTSSVEESTTNERMTYNIMDHIYPCCWTCCYAK